MFSKRKDKINKGASAPDFVLTDTTGKTVRLSDFRGQKNVVLVFARGFM